MKMRFTFDLDELEYAQLIRALLPYVKKEDIPLPEAVINAAGAPGVLENFLRFIPKAEQDKLVLSLFEKNRERMMNAIERFADKHGVEADVLDFKLDKIE